jgi:hypothetical protein
MAVLDKIGRRPLISKPFVPHRTVFANESSVGASALCTITLAIIAGLSKYCGAGSVTGKITGGGSALIAFIYIQ